jgi:hypothetical protein
METIEQIKKELTFEFFANHGGSDPEYWAKEMVDEYVERIQKASRQAERPQIEAEVMADLEKRLLKLPNWSICEDMGSFRIWTGWDHIRQCFSEGGILECLTAAEKAQQENQNG